MGYTQAAAQRLLLRLDKRAQRKGCQFANRRCKTGNDNRQAIKVRNKVIKSRRERRQAHNFNP